MVWLHVPNALLFSEIQNVRDRWMDQPTDTVWSIKTRFGISDSLSKLIRKQLNKGLVKKTELNYFEPPLLRNKTDARGLMKLTHWFLKSQEIVHKEVHSISLKEWIAGCILNSSWRYCQDHNGKKKNVPKIRHKGRLLAKRYVNDLNCFNSWIRISFSWLPKKGYYKM